MPPNLATISPIPKAQRTSELIAELVALWERSVTATHTFLSVSEIAAIKEVVAPALLAVEHLVVATNDQQDTALGFMGIEGKRLEMLFLEPTARGMGLGKTLLNYAIEKHHISELTVNEQNPEALGFYAHMGFTTYKRTPCDEDGRPYPLLYMHRI